MDTYSQSSVKENQAPNSIDWHVETMLFANFNMILIIIEA